VSIAHNSNQLLTTGGTVSAWIYPETSGQLSGRIVDKSSGVAAGNNGFTFYIGTDNTVKFRINAGTIISSASSSIQYNTTWYHTAVAFNSSGLVTFYVNGLVSGTPATTLNASYITTVYPLTIGNRSSYTDRTFDGIIDEVSVSNTLRSADWIAAEYNNQNSPSTFYSLAEEEIGLPDAPTIATPTALSSSVIRWNFTDNSSYETGFRVYTNADVLATSSATANLSSLTETGLSENTQYTRYIKAYNSYGESASSSATSTFTLMNAPTDFSFGTITTNSITVSASGTLSNLASSTSGVYFDETSGNSGGSDSSWQQTSSYQDTGLSENTQYTYRVKARNGDSAETSYTAASSKYTLADTPTGFSFWRYSNYGSLCIDALPNATAGSSGYLFWRTDNSAYNSGWIQTSCWQDPNMAVGSTYTYAVKYRNGDGVETATTTLPGVSFTSSVGGGGGGGVSIVQQQTTVSTTSASTTQATTTISATSTQNNTATTTTTVSKQPPTPSSQSQQAGSTGSDQAKQVILQQIQAKIVEVQKKLIILISQLIQLLQAQLQQLQTQH